ncbi:cytochrome P450 [Corynebacterium propinquum]
MSEKLTSSHSQSSQPTNQEHAEQKRADQDKLDIRAIDPTGRDPLAYSHDVHEQGCPIVHDDAGDIVVVGHAEATRIAQDAATFSSAVSRYLQIPNGLDGDKHTAFRRLLDHYLNAKEVARYSEQFRQVAREVIASFLADATAPGDSVQVDAVQDLGYDYAVRAMVAWLGWPREIEPRLKQWVEKNAAATRSGEQHRTARVAQEYDEIINEVVGEVRDSGNDCVTYRLINDTSLGRELEFDEIVSILRNWTGGDLGSMAKCVGVLLHALAENTVIQEHVRSGVPADELVAIVDEILRIDDPFVSNRRVTTCPVTIDGEHVEEGQRVYLHWTAANRDPKVFSNPDEYSPVANAENNLVWGTGPHACPGKDLSMVEIQAFVEELLSVANVRAGESGQGERDEHPVGGWSSLPITLERR